MGKNDNNTTNNNLSSGAVIVIVLVGAGFAMLCGWAIARHFYSPSPDSSDHAPGDGVPQATYMREVRLRNQELIEEEAGYGRGYAKRPVVQQRETQFSHASSMY